MADIQIPVSGGTLPQGACPTTPQELLDLFVTVLTVLLPAANSTVKISTSVTVDDIGKLWVKVDADGNPLGEFIYDADVGGWVRSRPHPFQPGFIQDWFFADTEANAKAAALLLDQANEPNPNAGNPYWRLCDGTNGTPDLRCRTLVGAGDPGTPATLTARANGDIFGAEKVALIVTELPQHNHVVGADSGTANNAANRMGVSAGTSQAVDASATTFGMHTENTGGDPTDSFNTKPHNNLPPAVAVWKIIRTARLY